MLEKSFSFFHMPKKGGKKKRKKKEKKKKEKKEKGTEKKRKEKTVKFRCLGLFGVNNSISAYNRQIGKKSAIMTS